MIRRRTLLLGGLGLVVIGGLGVWAFGRRGVESEIVSILRRRLDYLRLDEEGLRSFARDQTDRFLAKRVPFARLRYHFVASVSPSFTRFHRSTDTRSRVQCTEDMLAATFLVSSDFFFHDADESRTVRYLGYYDPFVHPCRTPFARPVMAGQ